MTQDLISAINDLDQAVEVVDTTHRLARDAGRVSEQLNSRKFARALGDDLGADITWEGDLLPPEADERVDEGGVITGTITNAQNEPVAVGDIEVFAVNTQTGGGVRGLVQMTNDRTSFVIQHLLPGAYTVVAVKNDVQYPHHEPRLPLPIDARHRRHDNVRIVIGAQQQTITISGLDRQAYQYGSTVNFTVQVQPPRQSVRLKVSAVTGLDDDRRRHVLVEEETYSAGENELIQLSAPLHSHPQVFGEWIIVVQDTQSGTEATKTITVVNPDEGEGTGGGDPPEQGAPTGGGTEQPATPETDSSDEKQFDFKIVHPKTRRVYPAGTVLVVVQLLHAERIKYTITGILTLESHQSQEVFKQKNLKDGVFTYQLRDIPPGKHQIEIYVSPVNGETKTHRRTFTASQNAVSEEEPEQTSLEEVNAVVKREDPSNAQAGLEVIQEIPEAKEFRKDIGTAITLYKRYPLADQKRVSGQIVRAIRRFLKDVEKKNAQSYEADVQQITSPVLQLSAQAQSLKEQAEERVTASLRALNSVLHDVKTQEESFEQVVQAEDSGAAVEAARALTKQFDTAIKLVDALRAEDLARMDAKTNEAVVSHLTALADFIVHIVLWYIKSMQDTDVYRRIQKELRLDKQGSAFAKKLLNLQKGLLKQDAQGLMRLLSEAFDTRREKLISLPKLPLPSTRPALKASIPPKIEEFARSEDFSNVTLEGYTIEYVVPSENALYAKQPAFVRNPVFEGFFVVRESSEMDGWVVYKPTMQSHLTTSKQVQNKVPPSTPIPVRYNSSQNVWET